MSTELQFRQSQLPEIGLQPIEINRPSVLLRCNSNIKDSPVHHQMKTEEFEEKQAKEEPGGCTTPKSDENRIPAMENCPPAPAKPKSRVIPCKRKLSEFQFFETQDGGGDQIESFFGSIETDQSRRKIRKRLSRL